jgi:hypothetical protein
MIITRDFQLSFDEEAFLKLHGPGLDAPGLRPKLAAALDEIESLVEPAACFDSYPIEQVLHDRLQIAGGVKIGGGPVMAVVAGAEELFVAVCTAGPALDERIREYRERGRYLQMLLLDELGSWAVDQLRQQLYERVQAELVERGWRTSSPLSPGESDWPMREQRIIFKLLDTAEIGVALGPSFMMSPLKSLSVIFGAGAQEMGSEGLTNCDFCSIQDRCRFTKTRDSERHTHAAAVVLAPAGNQIRGLPQEEQV